MNLANIPLELKEPGLGQYVFWKADKKPRNPHNNQLASVSDPKTWDTFENACKAMKDYGGKGVGFVFTENDPYCGIDLDKVIDEDGQIDPEAQDIINRLDSYTEISQSGRGIHIIVRGEKPSSRCRKKNIEIYDKGRYFALTVNLWQERAVIEDRQAELDWLCEETFGTTESKTEPMNVDELVLDLNAEPPEDKLEALLGDDDFEMIWEHKKRLPSLSDYDWHLACDAIDDGWNDQEIANLIIAFRRRHGKGDDLAKALRKDYIPNTIAKARAETKGAGVLALLPFKVAKVLQYGEQESEIFLVLNSGKQISMGSTDRYVSPRLAQARLVENQLGLPSKALKRWNEIVLALQPLMEIVETTTREEDTRSWLNDYIGGMRALPKIDEGGDLGMLFRPGGYNSIAHDKDGRLYLRLSDVTRFSAVHCGLRGVNTKTTSRDLRRIGFEPIKIRVEGDRQVRLWVSKPGFIEADKGKGGGS